MTLNLEKLCDLPLANIRKLYAMILSEPWRADNTNAAATVSAFLDEAIETSTNKALTRAVRRTKAEHERWKKLKAIWVDAQTRYSY